MAGTTQGTPVVTHLDPKQVETMRKLIAIYADVIQSEPQGVPSGVMYAAVMSAGITLTVHEAIVQGLIRAGLVKSSGHLLTWIGKR